MKQTSAILPLAFILLAAAGCGDKKMMPFLGQWNGDFVVSKVNRGPDADIDRKHHSLHGYVSLRLDKKSYLLHLEGEQQQVDVKGNWAYHGNQAVLSPSDVKVNNDNGAGQYNPNRKYVPDEDLYSAYNKKLILTLSQDGKTLQSPSMSIAFLEGEHIFTKD
ncbi:MAG: hypothetical protein JST12_18715 [Armatimonadetes bacterium]|nr:hypothetical protein [Armatimonadota bacterium]MBS1703703.1 hypothetical protein [Armatimonadota bacterium]MBS1726074.1 hypothetical protein [Armatimonadota bacterium]